MYPINRLTGATMVVSVTAAARSKERRKNIAAAIRLAFVATTVLPDGLDQLPLRDTLFTVILTQVIRVEACSKA